MYLACIGVVPLLVVLYMSGPWYPSLTAIWTLFMYDEIRQDTTFVYTFIINTSMNFTAQLYPFERLELEIVYLLDLP